MVKDICEEFHNTEYRKYENEILSALLNPTLVERAVSDEHTYADAERKE